MKEIIKMPLWQNWNKNYRSTKTILDTANELIKNNKSSKGKKLWTNGEKG